MWEYMRRINREEGTTIILTTHYLEEAESLCRNVGIINNGEIVRDTSLRDLLAELNTETFLLDLAHGVDEVPVIDGFEIRLVDNAQLAVVVHRGQRLNDVFASLSEQGIQVVSMRNRANRLEEMFVSMVEQGNERQAAARAMEASA
jgi:ABC-2 type transport system ATP-binding protein